YLLSGPIAVLDQVKRADGAITQSYAGDANVDDVPPGQERLLSYAVDQELSVDATKRDSNQRLLTGWIVKCVLNREYTDSISQRYVLDNKGELDKRAVVEHAIAQSYTLKTPEKSLEKTDRVYRFEVSAPAKKTVFFDVVEERVRGEEMAILPMD